MYDSSIQLLSTDTYTQQNVHAAAKSLQSRPTLCDPKDGSPPGSPVPGILQARTLEWVAISFSNAWKWKVKVKSLCCAQLLATPWTAAFQAPPSMGFSRQEYWSGVPLPSPQYVHKYTQKKDICVAALFKTAPNGKQPQMGINSRMDKHGVLYSYTGWLYHDFKWMNHCYSEQHD